MYVALENDEMAAAIDTVSNQVIASIPIGQTTPGLGLRAWSVAEALGTDNLMPLGQAANTARLRLVSSGRHRRTLRRQSL